MTSGTTGLGCGQVRHLVALQWERCSIWNLLLANEAFVLDCWCCFSSYFAPFQSQLGYSQSSSLKVAAVVLRTEKHGLQCRVLTRIQTIWCFTANYVALPGYIIHHCEACCPTCMRTFLSSLPQGEVLWRDLSFWQFLSYSAHELFAFCPTLVVL